MGLGRFKVAGMLARCSSSLHARVDPPSLLPNDDQPYTLPSSSPSARLSPADVVLRKEV
jgi:hypothetical protein